ncbi:MAG: helix-turn-helix transcriptional regulator [Bacteroidota bacterium]
MIPRYPTKASPTGLTLTSMQQVEDGRNVQQEVPHRHAYHTIIWVESAKGIHHLDSFRFPLGERQLYFLNPDQVHFLEIAGEPQGCVLTFEDRFVNQAGIRQEFLNDLQLFADCEAPAPVSVSEEQQAQLIHYLQAMGAAMEGEKAYQAEELGALLKLFLIHSKRLMDQQQLQKTTPANRAFEIVREFKRLLNQQFREFHKVQEYADQLMITPGYLNEVLRQETGQSAKQMIQARLTLEARRLAMHSGATMKEIGYALGFDDVAHFSKFFKAQLGESFSKYRRRRG